MHPTHLATRVTNLRTGDQAVGDPLLGGDPSRRDGRSNPANRLATEEAQLDWRL